MKKRQSRKSLLIGIVICLLLGFGGGCFRHFPSLTARFPRQLSNKLQESLDQIRIDIGVPGVAMIVAAPDGSRWVGASGLSRIISQKNDQESGGVPDPTMVLGLHGTPMDPMMQFHVASIKKTFVATIILMLADEGKLTLEDTVQSWLGPIVPFSNRITVRRLLNHTSGIASYQDNPKFYSDVTRNPRKKLSPMELIDYATAGQPYFKPGQGWHYSNTNYIILGLIAEQATGKNIDSLITNRLIRPLGLRHTLIPNDAAMPGYHCRGYRYDFLNNRGVWSDVTEFAHPSFMGAAGAMISSPNDLAIWLGAFLSGKFLGEQLVKEMYDFVPTGEPQSGYGLGLELRHGAIGHGGDYVFGFQSWMFRYRNYDFIILTNGMPTKLDIYDGPQEIFLKTVSVLFTS